MMNFNKRWTSQRIPERIDTIEFVGLLAKEDMLEAQVGEYNTEKDVNFWGIDDSPNPNREIKILEQDKRHIKFHIKNLNERGWSPLVNDPTKMNLRVWVFANYGEQPLFRTESFIGSKRSKVYHKKNCYFTKRIKSPIKLTEEDIEKRRKCKREK